MARRKKHVPQRTCVGCRQVLSKRELTRIVRSPEGVLVDPGGKLPGRGAYLHNQQRCWDLGLNGRLENALKTKLTDEEREKLQAHAEALPSEKNSAA